MEENFGKPQTRTQCFKNMEEVHDLTDILGEIDDMVLQHSQKDSQKEFDQTLDSFAECEQKQSVEISHQNTDSLMNEALLSSKGHYRGISFGLSVSEEIIPENYSDTTKSSKSIESSKNDCYIKMLEENNEVLKKSNEAFLGTLKEKDQIISLLKQQNEALFKQSVF